MNYTFISWDEIEQMVNAVIAKLHGPFDFMLAITRGGMVPSCLISEKTGLRNVVAGAVVLYSGVDESEDEPRILQFPDDSQIAGKRVLVVDDVWDTGRTLTAVRKRISDAGGTSTIVVMHYKSAKTRFRDDRPDVWAEETDDWIVYPWDPRKAELRYIAAKAKAEAQEGIRVPKILVTGFDPFGGESVNPSWMAVARLAGKKYSGYEAVCREIPAVYGKSSDMLNAMIDEMRPAAILSVGQAGSASAIRVERLAKNLDDARIKDNEGNQPTDMPIDPSGPVAYWATVPAREMVAAINDAGVPAIMSYSAGTFICNHVFYAASHFVAMQGLEAQVGFIHVPYAPEQVTNKPNMPSMSIDDISKAIDAALRVIGLGLPVI